MSEFEARIRGLGELKKKLYAYNQKLGEKVTRSSLRKGANVTLKAARALAPVKTGRLKKAIKLKNSRINRLRVNGKIGLYITVSKGKSRKDTKGAYYAQWVENGYNSKSKRVGKRDRKGGKPVQGQHFIKSAFLSTRDQATETIIREAEIAAQTIANQLGL